MCLSGRCKPGREGVTLTVAESSVRHWRSLFLLQLGIGLLISCAGLGATESLKARLIGIDARSLRRCVGVPTEIDVTGEREVLVYHFAVRPDRLRDEIPVRRSGGVLRVPPPGGRLGRSSSLSGFCELTFELQDGRVQGVEVRARRPSGLNDDAGCLRRADACAIDDD